MSFTFVPQYEETFPSENRDSSLDQEQGFREELRRPEKNFWSAIDKYFSFLRSTSPPSGSRNYFKKLLEAFTSSSLIGSCPTNGGTAVVSSAATASRGNFNPTPQKLNLNNFLMILLCACSPIAPPTKIMLCLPAQTCLPPDIGAAFSAGSQKKCDVHPFCVPQKLSTCNSLATSKGKYYPPPEKRNCPPGCLHVSDLKEAKPCLALEGLPCIAHCFESYPKKC